MSPVAAALVDRLDRRLLMLASHVLSAIAWIVLLLVRDPVALIALGLVAEVVAAPFRIPARAVSPNVVPPQGLSCANSLLAGANHL